MRKLFYTLNIPYDIVDMAEQYDLDQISTGGGLDYIWKLLEDNGMQMVLADAEYDGSPRSITSPCLVSIYKNNDWHDAVVLKFRYPVEAMSFMSDVMEGDFLP